MSSPSKEESTETNRQETTTKEEETKEEETSLENQQNTNNQENGSLWTAVWDDNAQAYYWWNTETNETTWINPEQPVYDTTTTSDTAAVATVAASHNPLDSILDKIDTDVKKQLDGEEAVSTNHESYEQYFEQPEASYTTAAHFNARTGRFTTQEDANRLNPENLTIENRATRQMQFYFDVDRYTEERNMQRAYTADGRVGKKKQLSRKEVEYFKKMKKEKKSKKAREWLMQ